MRKTFEHLLFRMIQSLRTEAGKSEDMFALLQEIEESVRLTFLNCFLDFAGTMNNLFLFYVWK
jgi:exocyst complex component 2